MTVSAASSRNVTPENGSHVLQAQRVAELEPADVDLDVLRNIRRQRLDVKLARDLLHHATDLCPRRLADELHRDRRLDRLVEANLVKVDVRDRPTDGVLLVILENGVMRGLLALDHDIDDPVQT